MKPTRAGSSIGVTVAYGVTDSLKKASGIISEVLIFPLFVFWLSFVFFLVGGGLKNRIDFETQPCFPRENWPETE